LRNQLKGKGQADERGQKGFKKGQKLRRTEVHPQAETWYVLKLCTSRISFLFDMK
jgi:hypothetical protein